MDQLSEPELENILCLVKGVGDLIQDKKIKLLILPLLFSGIEVSIPENNLPQCKQKETNFILGFYISNRDIN